MSAKQKIVHGRGLSNLNLGIFVCSFDVCRASKPVPSFNFDLLLSTFTPKRFLLFVDEHRLNLSTPDSLKRRTPTVVNQWVAIGKEIFYQNNY